MNANCPICHGSGAINFHVVEQMPLRHYLETPKISATGFVERRTYPCPECSVVPTVRLLEQSVEIEASVYMMRGPGLDDAIKRELVLGMSQKIASDGLITFETIDKGQTLHARTMTARLWLVDPKGGKLDEVLNTESRLAGERYAVAAIHDLLREVNNWGSHYHHETISKAKVNDLADEVLKRIRSRTDVD